MRMMDIKRFIIYQLDHPGCKGIGQLQQSAAEPKAYGRRELGMPLTHLESARGFICFAAQYKRFSP
eukprot:1605788-Rhodomonas_salina.1